MRPDKYQIPTQQDTGPIDVEEIKRLTQDQKKRQALDKRQKQKHELRVEEIRNEPIKFSRLIRSFKYAFQGVKYVFYTQPNMKIHVIMAVIAIILGFVLHVSEAEWLALVLVIGFVIILEFINTAIETLVDLYTEKFSFLAKVGKDVGAATVFVMAVISVVVGIIIFIPKIIRLFL